VKGKADWLTLPRCPGFNICPSCYTSTFESTSFQHFFVPAPFRSLEEEVQCDFGAQAWYRIAWLLVLKNKEPDLTKFYEVAKIEQNVPPCLGGHEAVRKWHSVLDPATGDVVRNFDVCFACVRIIESLLPQLKGIFVLTNTEGPAGPRRVCDMRFDTERFVLYFDALERCADRTPKVRGEYRPDPALFVDVCKKFAVIPPCPREKEGTGRWYRISHLPELTVCPSCYEEVIRPEVQRRKALATMFEPGRSHTEKGNCGLYSEQMRKVFRRAVEEDDYRSLAVVARKRRERLEEFREDVEYAGKIGGSRGEEELERARRRWRRYE
jgi:hypothetical protein